jgi:hypothetical protein
VDQNKPLIWIFEIFMGNLEGLVLQVWTPWNRSTISTWFLLVRGRHAWLHGWCCCENQNHALSHILMHTCYCTKWWLFTWRLDDSLRLLRSSGVWRTRVGVYWHPFTQPLTTSTTWLLGCRFPCPLNYGIGYHQHGPHWQKVDIEVPDGVNHVVLYVYTEKHYWYMQ